MRFFSKSVLLFAASGGVALAAGDFPGKEIALHAFNLALLLGLLVFLLRGRIRDALGNRAAQTRSDIEEAEQMRAEARSRFDELEGKLGKFEQQLVAMRDEAEADAEAEKKALLQRAERDAANVLAAAERTIRDETERARHALRAEAAALAVEVAGKQVTAQIGPDDEKRLAGDFLGAVNGSSNGVGHG